MESVLVALYMDGKIISWSLQWHWFEAQISSESTGIVRTSEHPESVRLPQHNLLGRSPVYHLGAHRGVSRGVIHDLNLIFSSRRHIRVRVLFRSSFPLRNWDRFIVIVATSPFTVIQGPRSWSPPLCRLVLWNWVLEPHIYPFFIYICNFRLRVSTFLLVFFDSLAGKAFSARSIKLCLVDNQRSSGVMVAGLQIMSD